MDADTLWAIAGVFTAGAVVGGWLTGRSNDSYLLSKADDSYGRTAVCVRGKFFYVVPESEYVQLDILRVRQTNPTFADTLEKLHAGEPSCAS